ncbi:tyrosine-type recombinase/integrase [Pseudomonas sp. B11]
MATLETINYQRKHASLRGSEVVWASADGREGIPLPQICWADGSPWREPNLWATQRCELRTITRKTIASTMAHLHAYAKWLESEQIAWFHFPAREQDRCLIRFRSFLVALVDRGELAPSTAQQRMARVIRFYRWAVVSGLIASDWPMWTDKIVGVKLVDKFGLERTMSVESTNLSIPNKKSSLTKLEDGLIPVTAAEVPNIIKAAEEWASEELSLLIQLGFGTGMRIGTLIDLKVATISRATPSPTLEGFYCLAVGPGAHPPVATKFGVTGQALINQGNLEKLKSYIYSARRLKRVALARKENSNLVFLSRFGAPYATVDGAKSINVELGRLRNKGLREGIHAFDGFHFHRTRCTFATELARAALKYLTVSDAITLVKGALLHKDEKTTLGYIKFIESHAEMSALANEFTRKFLGTIKNDGLNNGE